MQHRILLRQYQQVFRISRWMRLHFSFMGHLCLLMLLISGVFGVDTSATLSYQLFMFLLVLFSFALIGSVVNRFKATIKRQLPRYATVGEPLNYRVTISNSTQQDYYALSYIEQLSESFPSYAELITFYQRQHKPWYQRLISFRLWQRYIIHQRGGYIDEQAISSIPAQQSSELKMSVIPLRRGKLHFSGAYIAKTDVFGLFRRLYFAAEPQSCLVLPKRYAISPLNLKGKRLYQSGGVSGANSVGDSAEFMSLRDYRVGDALNQIHWKSFARHGKLIVKEYQDEYFVRRALILDTDLGESNSACFEAAISVVASLAISEQQSDALLDLMFVGAESYRFTTGRGIDQMPHLQEILAAVQASDAGSFARLKKSVEAHSKQCSSLVCVLLHWDKQRQDFIRALAVQQIPVAVFLITDKQISAVSSINQPVNFHLIHPERIAEELAVL